MTIKQGRAGVWHTIELDGATYVTLKEARAMISDYDEVVGDCMRMLDRMVGESQTISSTTLDSVRELIKTCRNILESDYE